MLSIIIYVCVCSLSCNTPFEGVDYYIIFTELKYVTNYISVQNIWDGGVVGGSGNSTVYMHTLQFSIRSFSSRFIAVDAV